MKEIPFRYVTNNATFLHISFLTNAIFSLIIISLLIFFFVYLLMRHSFLFFFFISFLCLSSSEINFIFYEIMRIFSISLSISSIFRVFGPFCRTSNLITRVNQSKENVFHTEDRYQQKIWWKKYIEYAHI